MKNPIHGSTRGYYAHVDDRTQTERAQRSDFRPSLNNRFTNRLGSSNNAAVKAFGSFINGLRNIDLKGRGMVAEGRAMASRALIEGAKNFDGMRPSVKSVPAVADMYVDKRRTQTEAVELRYSLKQERHQHKREIGRKAVEGNLARGVKDANEAFQRRLNEDDRFKPLDMSGARVPDPVRPNYLTSSDGYVIKTKYDRPSHFAVKTAAQVSRQYEQGDSGLSRQLRSVDQHIRLGVLNAALWAKEHAKTARAGRTDLPPARRDALVMEGKELRAQRNVNRESLKGPYALADAIEAASAEREWSIAELRKHRGASMYVERTTPNGVAPQTVSRIAERAQAYSDTRQGGEVGSKHLKWMTSIANSLSESRAERSEHKVEKYQLRLKTETDERKASILRGKLDIHRQQAVDARERVGMRNSAMKGQLYEALRKKEADDDKRFPRVDQEPPGMQHSSTWDSQDSQKTQVEMREIDVDLGPRRELNRWPGTTTESTGGQHKWPEFPDDVSEVFTEMSDDEYRIDDEDRSRTIDSNWTLLQPPPSRKKKS